MKRFDSEHTDVNCLPVLAIEFCCEIASATYAMTKRERPTILSETADASVGPNVRVQEIGSSLWPGEQPQPSMHPTISRKRLIRQIGAHPK